MHRFEIGSSIRSRVDFVDGAPRQTQLGRPSWVESRSGSLFIDARRDSSGQ